MAGAAADNHALRLRRTARPASRSDPAEALVLARLRGLDRRRHRTRSPRCRRNRALPSAVRGAGAVRLGWPSASRGTSGVVYLGHCAETVVVTTATRIPRTILPTTDLIHPPAHSGSRAALEANPSGDLDHRRGGCGPDSLRRDTRCWANRSTARETAAPGTGCSRRRSVTVRDLRRTRPLSFLPEDTRSVGAVGNALCAFSKEHVDAFWASTCSGSFHRRIADEETMSASSAASSGVPDSARASSAERRPAPRRGGP